MRTPPNVDAVQWNAALQGFKSAVGAEWIFTSEEDLALYRDPYSPLWGEEDERLAAAAVAPATVEEVQSVVRIANQFGIPLYSVSTGKNLGYGGASPNVSGSVVVDLRRMNRIIEVDDKRHFAIVEPGVSYFDLYHHIQERGLNVMIDCPDPGWGSVMGNALDHGCGWTSGGYRDHFWSHCGMEVVLPNGELLRTGMGALPNSKTFADFRYGFGPYVDGLFSQAGFGIVTRMGIHLMPQPESYMRKEVLVFRREDLVPLVEVTSRLENSGITGMSFIDNLMFYLQAQDPELRAIAAMPDVWNGNAINRYAAEKQVPAWKVALTFYGPLELNEAKWKYARAEIEKTVPGARFEDVETVRLPAVTPEAQAAVHHKVEAGIPSLGVFSLGARGRFNPGPPTDGHLLFSPIMQRDGEEILKAQRIFAEGMKAGDVDHNQAMGLFGFGPYSPPFSLHARTSVLVGFVPVWKSDPEANKRSRAAMHHLIDLGAKHGYGEYRAPPIFQEQVMSTYSFNNHALRRFCETLKDAIDPKGIISPGRGGFWPRSMRREG